MPGSIMPFFYVRLSQHSMQFMRDVAVAVNSAPIIEVDGVSFVYAGADGKMTKVLDDLNLSIKQGTFVSIMGHNGSGKSTLAKLLNALYVPNEGVLRICQMDTRQTASIWEIRRNVGMIFQNPDNQIIGTTVEDDVAFGLENLGVPPEEMRRRVDESLASVQMEKFALSQPHKLSGGQKQRVAIAGVMALKPSVIIMDEATAMLDPQGRKEVLALAHQLNKTEGVTVLNITHFPEETIDSDRVIVMSAGEILLDGSPGQVYQEYETLRAAGLDVPFAVRMHHRLAEAGIPLGPSLRQEGMVEELCRFLLNR